MKEILKLFAKMPLSWEDNPVKAEASKVKQRRGSEERIWQTGPELIDRIVRAIELNQSVLLSGPRGCGKSYCIAAAVREAQRRGILTAGSELTCQGNREVARDYLMEDDVVFRLNEKDGKIIPEMRSAPLFQFAARDGSNEPLVDPASRNVSCTISFGRLERPVKRFSLFLDEINRFSDGVLDGLLSILEEKVAFLRGRSYRIPVVVLMTMNPPGYDATARSLSPPLAARISRSYELSTPDIDTLTDQIIAQKMRSLEDEVSKNTATGSATSIDVRPANVLYIDPLMRRRAALVTLLLWGNPVPPVGSQPRPSVEYLTKPTVQLLSDCLKQSRSDRTMLRDHLDTLSELCRFGPDGRAAADWLTSAAARALQERDGHEQVSVNKSNCLETAIESLSHKIYDDFSPASEPEKVRRKETAVLGVCELVMDGRFDELIKRTIDDKMFALNFKEVITLGVGTNDRIYNAFVQNGVTDNLLVNSVVNAFQKGATRDSLTAELLKINEHSSNIFVDNEADWKACFTSHRWEQFVRAFAALDGILPDACRDLLARTARPRQSYRATLSLAKAIGADKVTLDQVVLIAKTREVLMLAEKLRDALDFFHETPPGRWPAEISGLLTRLCDGLKPESEIALKFAIADLRQLCQNAYD